MTTDTHHGIETGESLRTDGGRTYDVRLMDALGLVESVRRNAIDDDTAAAGPVVQRTLENVERQLHLVRFALESWQPKAVTDGGQEVDRVARVRQAFAGVPKIDPENERHREVARVHYPPEVVPDSGPVPEPVHHYEARTFMPVPDWVIESVVWWFAREHDENGTLPAPDDVHGKALTYAQPQTEFIGSEDSAYPDVPLEEIVAKRVGLNRSEGHDDE